jgi:hypothetical protein
LIRLDDTAVAVRFEGALAVGVGVGVVVGVAAGVGVVELATIWPFEVAAGPAIQSPFTALMLI